MQEAVTAGQWPRKERVKLTRAAGGDGVVNADP